MTKIHNNTKALTANIKGRILQGRCAKYYIGNVTSVVFFDVIWPSGMHVTWPFVMPSRGLCRQSSYARMLDFDPTQLCSMWTRADISGKLCRNKFMSDHCSGIAMWTWPKTMLAELMMLLITPPLLIALLWQHRQLSTVMCVGWWGQV